jgi:hypothetical protein
MNQTYRLDCGHTAEFRDTARNIFYAYTMGQNANDLSLSCPEGCGLRTTKGAA